MQPKNQISFQEIEAHSKKFSQSDDRRAFWILITTLFFNVLPVFLYFYIPNVVYIFFRSYVTVRIFMIFHDCCHSAFFQSQKLNARVGIFLGGLVGTPYESFRDRHLYHHKISGTEGLYDPGATILFTKQDYERYPFWKKAIWRVARDPFVFFSLIPAIKMIIWHRFREGGIKANIVMFSWFFFIYEMGVDLRIELISSALSAGIGFLLFHFQHTVNDPYIVDKQKHSIKEAAISGSTYLLVPWWLKGMTFGIEYHHIHHFNTKVPCYKLQECHEANEKLWTNCLHVDYLKAFRSLFHTMYNKETNRYESFPFYEAILQKLLPRIS